MITFYNFYPLRIRPHTLLRDHKSVIKKFRVWRDFIFWIKIFNGVKMRVISSTYDWFSVHIIKGFITRTSNMNNYVNIANKFITYLTNLDVRMFVLPKKYLIRITKPFWLISIRRIFERRLNVVLLWNFLILFIRFLGIS